MQRRSANTATFLTFDVLQCANCHWIKILSFLVGIHSCSTSYLNQMQCEHQTCTCTYSGFQSFLAAGAQKKHQHTREQMCPPHCPHTAGPDGTKFPPAIFGSSNSSVGNRAVCQGDLPGGVQRVRSTVFATHSCWDQTECAGLTKPQQQLRTEKMYAFVSKYR